MAQKDDRTSKHGQGEQEQREESDGDGHSQRRLDDPGLKWCGLSGLGQGRSEEAGGVGLVEQR